MMPDGPSLPRSGPGLLPFFNNGETENTLVKPQYNLFKRSQAKSAKPSELKSHHAILSIICTYHLYEWVHGGKKFVLRTYRGSPKTGEALEIARQLTNGSKHFERWPLQGSRNPPRRNVLRSSRRRHIQPC